MCSQIRCQVLVKIFVQWNPSLLIQTGCYFTDQLHNIEVTKKKNHLTHTRVFSMWTITTLKKWMHRETVQRVFRGRVLLWAKLPYVRILFKAFYLYKKDIYSLPVEVFKLSWKVQVHNPVSKTLGLICILELRRLMNFLKHPTGVCGST